MSDFDLGPLNEGLYQLNLETKSGDTVPGDESLRGLLVSLPNGVFDRGIAFAVRQVHVDVGVGH